MAEKAGEAAGRPYFEWNSDSSRSGNSSFSVSVFAQMDVWPDPTLCRR